MKTATTIELVGHTPLVDLSGLVGKPGVSIFGKAEGNNPGGSVKDRPALNMVLGAEARGELRPGVKIIEATSGNTGIALAMISAMKGYDIELVMPESATRERVLAMRAYGATVTLTPAAQRMEGATDYARAKVAAGGYLMLDQFSNPDNWRAHERSTGPEIWAQTDGRITHLVSAMGTTGTIMGCSRYLKSRNAAVQVVGAQPEGDSRIPGIRRWPVAYRPKIFDPAWVDRTVDVSEAAARAMTRRLAQEHGVSCGMSAGGAAHVAISVAAEVDDGVIVFILCDRGDRYLSTDLFA
ncbi:MAG: cysteine synthase CysM [Proteobacteria bacterium]|nr:MAG: cysteine synthase CysM [Pseudomonadota bacterium]